MPVLFASARHGGIERHSVKPEDALANQDSRFAVLMLMFDGMLRVVVMSLCVMSTH